MWKMKDNSSFYALILYHRSGGIRYILKFKFISTELSRQSVYRAPHENIYLFNLSRT